ncbi:CHAT domain protein [compost metagenome]
MPPELDNKYCCIVNHDKYILGALVSSYIYFDKYIPFFTFLKVSKEEDFIDSNFLDEHQISRSRSRTFNIRVNNCISRMRHCETIILIGLTEEQRSYLTFPEHINVIEIEDEQDVENYLLGIAFDKKKLKCTTNSILESLNYAHKNNLRLEVDNYTKPFISDIPHDRVNGLIAIEKHLNASTIVAINYASSINAEVKFIEPSKIGEYEVNDYIERWKLENDDKALSELREVIVSGIDNMNLDFSFITFFTVGIPYSLIFENLVPITHVHLNLDPDFFIFNNIYFEDNEQYYSSLVFSPKLFSNEETQNVIQNLQNANYLIFDLLDEDATSTNIDYAVQTLPFSLLHFCSHGGPIKGSRNIRSFTDRSGNTHLVEYDQVLSVMPERGKELIKVMLKYLPRKLDNYIWKSKELKELNYPHYVFVDMQKAISSLDDRKFVSKKPMENIPNSCAIICKNFHYQAMFTTFCDNHSPLIFNNTCWSNSDIKTHFIANGSRAYIGTLWNINNSSARDAANMFYSEIFDKTFLENYYRMQNEITECSDKNVYIFWGLHFSTLQSGIDLEHSKRQILNRLKNAVFGWNENFLSTSNVKTKKTIQDFISFLNANIFKIVKKTKN